MKTPNQQSRTIELDAHRVLVLDGGRARRVQVLSGAVWLTDETAAGDCVLQAGTDAAFGYGRIVIEPIGTARLRIVEGATPWRAAWQHLRISADALRQRLQFGESATSGVF